ncbi:hypothetical protein N9M90_03815 [Alphaproteobacteria bacterium]|jgi:hypothetical protein|nr:hypothetical protein [Alphaproteobacteria bacterium]MDA8723905.1 hypothetical protein [Alphaproteobacteria bacterium]MDO7559507.1 hypothetical protein [Paracoccaceae bacterium]
MADQKTLIRIMGESDIVDVTMTRKAASHALLMGLDAADKVNLLGHWMDQDRGAELAADQNHLDAMTIIASEIIASEIITSKATAGSALASQFEAGANFVLLTLLREKWPVGSKAKFKTIADRVKADHTYLAHICAAAKLDDLDDEDSLKQEETRQLSLSLAFYKANRRRFANSSAVQGLIKG